MRDLTIAQCAHPNLYYRSLQWAESKYSAVGGFLFLRFICPAIVSPETVDLPVDPSFRKGLLLITKIMQNLANNVLFGKEQHMMVLNGLLEDNILSVTHFLSEVVVSDSIPLSWLLFISLPDFARV